MTSARSAAERVRTAQTELDMAHLTLVRDTTPIRASFRRHPIAWIVTGGLLGGFALSWLPTRLWTKIDATIAGGGALLARSLLTPLIVGALSPRTDSSIKKQV
ncbi:MAG TPA: hypothetical protein VIE67_12960 [Rudaea sp.]|jgi:hypothetical protein|uniref:hypothetical protein n=1 Tax=Rudaea sp. TaxID=2136325 RepID=UPI002F946C03